MKQSSEVIGKKGGICNKMVTFRNNLSHKKTAEAGILINQLIGRAVSSVF